MKQTIKKIGKCSKKVNILLERCNPWPCRQSP